VFRPLEKHSLAVYDEPTSVLDPMTWSLSAEERMMVMVVTHEMGFAREGAQRVVFMDAGAIVESGAPDEFFAHPKTDRSGRCSCGIDYR